MTLAFVLLPLLAIPLLLKPVLFPLLSRTVGSALGWYLRTKTSGRRHHILELVERDEERHQEEAKERKAKEEDDGWETVDSYALGTSQNGDKGEAEWDGIVGFLHPFW